mmetsp:Transcript_71948/g.145947  ORF Transcript_71948/g.145947 Transcript_71948/m.145947 type:complete len:99 (+) Transcript_71948:865-1161(+)
MLWLDSSRSDCKRELLQNDSDESNILQQSSIDDIDAMHDWDSDGRSSRKFFLIVGASGTTEETGISCRRSAISLFPFTDGISETNGETGISCCFIVMI